MSDAPTPRAPKARERQGTLRGLGKLQIVQTLFVAHIVFAAAVALWFLGFLERAELTAYDNLVAVRAALYHQADPILIVGADDQDLNDLDWPLPDQTLARILDRLESAGPAVVGIDLWRDRPRGEGIEALDRVLETHDNIIGIYRFTVGRQSPIPGPPKLQGTDRLGFANVVPDPDGVVRRGLLFADDGKQSSESFAFRLARGYLASHGLALANDPVDPDVLLLGRGRLSPLSGTDGGYVGADAGGYQILADYLGGVHPFPTVTLRQVLAGAVPADIIKGKVVIIGVAADSVKDYFVTPIGKRNALVSSNVFGIEMHGHLVAELIRAASRGLDPPRGVGWSWSVLLFWLASLAGALAGAQIRTVATMVAAYLGIVLAVGGAGLGVLNLGIWIPVVCPSLCWIGGASLESTLLFSQEHKLRRQLMQMFSQNVSPAIAKELWERRDEFTAGGRPRSQKLTATVLFTDVKGFTSVSENMDPEILLDWLNRYMATMAEAAIKYDGVINKYIGDSLMAIFGVPIARETRAEIALDAQHAVRCAIEMRRVLGDLNAAWKAAGKPEIGMRIGINTGPVVAGTLGSLNRLEYTVLGDTVNTASRLESFDKSVAADEACRILISETTLSYLADLTQTERVGAVQLKGKEATVPIYLVH